MKKLTAIIAILFFGSIGFAQKGAKIEFKAKNNTIDFGIINKQNDNGIRSFEYTNTGDAPLIIYSIQSTSSCTILSKQNETVQPGKSGKIDIKYNMVPGPIRKTITVESNAINYDEGRIPLKIKGEVVSL
ncbi:Protein of unknown function [Flavobacterium glycines]|jgi:hypothetical protein|uniref:DUF1573 domain-containing protein n=1 Tax=Flavobacterium glycines TaxID=551990 RepID=A0A1B9DH55_9FLAO|nr:DUF1573 domain-containing protein [Flavobacterium glycines]OCB69013.1 hypothetical protein FBGL_13305 [Flavobacterium glycines]GEL12441.1 hypothetical protein FGL01_31800 [Flavobacterium glycines]SDJ51239.1 Protein of unknown function [Flavobacterium glycines]